MSDGIRQALLSSLFTQGSGEKLIVHVKTYKDIQSSGNSKDIKGTPRYLCLTQKKNTIRLLKVKRSQNGTFSISKAWNMDDIREIQIVDAHQFSITLNKTYLWAVERGKDKMIFLAFLIDSCRRSANRMPNLVNIDEARIIRFLADPSAPSMGTTSMMSPTSDIENSRNNSINITQSPVSHDSPFPSSPSTSSGFGYHSNSLPPMSARSVPDQQIHVASPMQLHPPATPLQQTKPSTPKQSTVHKSLSTPKPTVTIQQPSREEDRYNERDERKERDRAREAKREKEKQEKRAMEDKQRQKKAEEIQEKMTEQASLMNVEELLTDFNWKASGNAAALEKRLLGELHALEAANVHAIIQSDERVRSIVDHIDKSLEELDSMESWLLLYGAELNVSDKKPSAQI